MDQKKLAEYFSKHRSKGYSAERLHKEARKQGWAESDIQKAWKDASSPVYMVYGGMALAIIVLSLVFIKPWDSPTAQVISPIQPQEFPYQPDTAPDGTIYNTSDLIIKSGGGSGKGLSSPSSGATSAAIASTPSSSTSSGGGGGGGGGGGAISIGGGSGRGLSEGGSGGGFQTLDGPTSSCTGVLTGDTTLTSDVSVAAGTNGNCFILTTNNIVLDCAGFQIRGNAAGSLINNTPGINTITIKNCNLANASLGIDMLHVNHIIVFNNNFSGSSMRFLGSGTIAQNATIAANSNVSNITLNVTVNASIENNTLQSLLVNESGPPVHTRESNRYINNSIRDGQVVLGDQSFRFERNVVMNMTNFNITGFGGLIFNNTFRNVSIDASIDNASSDMRYLQNTFVHNRTSSARCVNQNGAGFATNITFANNTFLECGVLIGTAGNLTMRDNRFELNFTHVSLQGLTTGVVLLANSKDVFIDNLTIFVNGSTMVGLRLNTQTNNITIANSTIINTFRGSQGAGISSGNSGVGFILADSRITGDRQAVDVGSPWANSTFTGNVFSQYSSSAGHYCLDIGSTHGLNRTVIRGNTFNCSRAIGTSGGQSRIHTLNFTDNILLNGSVELNSFVRVENLRITNNSFNQPGGLPNTIQLTNTSSVFMANNTINNGSISFGFDARNITVYDTYVANSSIGFNITGGLGIFVSNATFSGVGRPFVLTNALNVTINNSIASPNVLIEDFGSETHTRSRLNFTAGINFTRNVSLISYLNLSNTTVYLNSSFSPGLNVSAIIRLNSSGFANPIPKIALADSQIFATCSSPRCSILSSAGDFISFNVSSFTTYSLGENSGIANVSGVQSGYTVTDTAGNPSLGFNLGDTIQIRNGSQRLIEFIVLNTTNLTRLNVTHNATRVAVHGFNETQNLSGNHTLYVPNQNGGAGVFVCPNVFTIADVLGSCSGAVSFLPPFPRTISTGAGLVTVTLDTGDYKIAGLNQSGGGNGPSPAGVANATDVRGAAVTVNSSARYNQTFGVINLGQGGNTTQVNFSNNATSNKWAGFFGNVSGALSLGAGGQTLYDFATVLPLFVAITQDPLFNFASIDKANTTLVDSHFGFTTSDTDSATAAFNNTGKSIAGISSVPFAPLQGGAWYSGIFDNSSPATGVGDPRFYAFGVEVNRTQTDFKGTQSDFELLVALNSTASNSKNTVYFFMDIQ